MERQERVIVTEGNMSNIVTVTYQLTPRLRWWNNDILEQAWQCLENGDLKWEPVPHE